MIDLTVHLPFNRPDAFRVAKTYKDNGNMIDLRMRDGTGSHIELTLFNLSDSDYYALVGAFGDRDTIHATNE